MSKTTTSQNTRDAIQKLIDFYDDEPKKWVKRSYYAKRNPKTGRVIRTIVAPQNADCFCLVGATEHLVSPLNKEGVLDALATAIRKKGHERRSISDQKVVIRWNDAYQRRFYHVKALLKEALELC